MSWSEETKKAKNGNHEVKLYDEEGYSNLKKAQRSGENTQNVKPLASLNGILNEMVANCSKILTFSFFSET